MLRRKQEYIEYTQDAKNIANSEECLQAHSSKLESLEDSIKAQELLVPVIGGFSAGKSSLLNNFLGVDILKVGIAPETAIATELRYSSEEKIEAIKDDERVDVFGIDKLEYIKDNAQNYSYIKLYLNNQQLKEIEPIVLVDMPGFNAPISTHNKAILKYMPSGVYFIVLMSAADERVIQNTLLKELRVIKEREKDFTFCISKTEMISESDVKEIIQNAKETLEVECGYEKNIELMKHENSGDILSKILKNIDWEKIFEDIFKPSLEFSKIEMDSSINTALKTLKSSEEESNNAISVINSDIQKLQNAISGNIQANLGIYTNFISNVNSYVESILSRIESDITAQSSLLATQALKGGNIEKSINDIIVPVMQLEVERNLSGLQNAITNNIKSEISTFGFDAASIKTWANALNDVTQKSAQMSKKIMEDEFMKTMATNNPKVGLYAMIAEFVLEIFSVITEFFAGKKKEEVAKEKIENEIVPSIKIQLRPKLEYFFIEQGKVLYENMLNAIKEQLGQKQKEVEEAKKLKVQNINNVEVKILALQAASGDLQRLAEKIQLKAISCNA
ncbi:dynamin family protein [Campylobacter sp.]|uniref:dynamin family protein n=1 Tax=Campylobacter sp. TaxID=205 RepID=UPI002A75C73C|nr:dynamin family protein [Campylobacter sp.]MDY2763752.1 dynamin family protein [Campylobacter sp.]